MDDNNKAYEQSRGSKLFEDLLVFGVETLARAGAKFVESIVGDTRKAAEREVVSKLEVIEHNVKSWRETRLGDVDSDLPESLRDHSSGGSDKDEGARK